MASTQICVCVGGMWCVRVCVCEGVYMYVQDYSLKYNKLVNIPTTW